MLTQKRLIFEEGLALGPRKKTRVSVGFKKCGFSMTTTPPQPPPRVSQGDPNKASVWGRISTSSHAFPRFTKGPLPNQDSFGIFGLVFFWEMVGFQSFQSVSLFSNFKTGIIKNGRRRFLLSGCGAVGGPCSGHQAGQPGALLRLSHVPFFICGLNRWISVLYICICIYVFMYLCMYINKSCIFICI